MLYPKNKTDALDPALYQNPTSEYRAAPFWAWNCELDPKLLEKEIDYMRDMGFGGCMMHPRVGLATPYLSEDFMALVRTCVEKCRKNEMLAWLYDEDKWPSGYAGGLNTADEESRQKLLYFTGIPYNDGTLITEQDKQNATDKLPETKSVFLACFDVEKDASHRLVSYRRITLADEVPEGHEKWFAYLEYALTTPRHNNQAYCDTLQKRVIENFVAITHERYKAHFKEDFGGIVPAIFTDEPQFRPKKTLPFAADRKGITFPYTTDFDETFFAAYGIHIEDHLPVLVWEPADGVPSQIRYFYHDHVAERFAEAFADTIGKWCEENGLPLTGHLMEEPNLVSQTNAVGDAMRSYRSFQLPGIDMLCNHTELNTAKQAQSAAHQYGRAGVASELYGVTNWNFDFRGHKLQGDWQAALGVTVRIPHLFWVSMGGEAKRDYPASIGYQSPWYAEYKHIEDHFARVNTVMTRGKPIVKLGVIHPLESVWLHYGPNDQTGGIRADKNRRFDELTRWMLIGFHDFDFICEALLPSLHKETASGFAVGEMCYETVIVPAMETIRRTTLDALRAFRKRGGEVIFIGEIPRYVDALPSDEVKAFAEECTAIPWSRTRLNEALEDKRFFSVREMSGSATTNVISQLRKDGDRLHLFLSHLNEPRNYDVAPVVMYRIAINGEWTVHEYETLSGVKRRLGVRYENGKTILPWSAGPDDSLLLELTAGKDMEEGGYRNIPVKFDRTEYPTHKVAFSLSEPNVLLLDRAEYRIADGEWQPALNILKADDAIREALGYRLRGGHMAQPWLEPLDKDPKDRVSLRYRFDSDIEYEGAKLAMECPEYSTVTLNGEPVPVTVDGWYIDEASIKTIALPKLKKGVNELVIDLRFGDITQLEAYYLLGSFGVEHHGVESRITKLPDVLYFDDITRQGLPFYGANITYRFTVMGGGRKTLEISRYRGAVIKVYVDGEHKGYIDFPPHRCDLGELSEGEHTVELVFFGNRMNTLGQLHNTGDNIPWANNASWKTTGRFWTDEYMLYPTGILTAPALLTEKEP
ncbi:MAG: hypothetical protein IJV98_02895 [Clostridia bacterium]|nr:hypothetical protein [Clostridia bacterium]